MESYKKREGRKARNIQKTDGCFDIYFEITSRILKELPGGTALTGHNLNSLRNTGYRTSSPRFGDKDICCQVVIIHFLQLEIRHPGGAAFLG